MKIIIDKSSNKKEKSKKQDGENIEFKPHYFVEKRKMSSTGIKVIAFVLLVLLGGAIGGALTNYGLSYFEDKKEEALVNKNVTSYNFATVENPVVAISEKVGPSVIGVKVTYTSQNFWGSLSEAEGQGSGIIYSEDGYIITNYHVVEAAIKNSSASVYVLFPNSDEEIIAKIVGSDETTDLAVLKVDKKGLLAAEFGKSESVKVGELAVAIGNPLGQEFAGSITVGYISAVNRTITTSGRTYNLIQTDAAINSGNSGGALVNSTGHIIGVNTAKIVAQDVEGMGFAIPIDEVLPIVEELITNKKISRPYIGIGGISITETMATRYELVEGVYVQTIEKASPAELAGIKQGDVVTEVSGKKVTSVNEINAIKNKHKIGEKLVIKVYRDKEYKEITVILLEG